jgi:hypothetical protein
MNIDYECAHLWTGDPNAKNGVIEALRILQNYYPEFLVRPLDFILFYFHSPVCPSIRFSYIKVVKLLYQRTQDLHMAAWHYWPCHIACVCYDIGEDQRRRSGLPYEF